MAATGPLPAPLLAAMGFTQPIAAHWRPPVCAPRPSSGMRLLRYPHRRCLRRTAALGHACAAYASDSARNTTEAPSLTAPASIHRRLPRPGAPIVGAGPQPASWLLPRITYTTGCARPLKIAFWHRLASLRAQSRIASRLVPAGGSGSSPLPRRAARRLSNRLSWVRPIPAAVNCSLISVLRFSKGPRSTSFRFVNSPMRRCKTRPSKYRA